MANLKLISGTTAPSTASEQVRARLRKTKSDKIPQCPSCSGRTYVEVKTGTLKQQCCVFCLQDKRLVSMV